MENNRLIAKFIGWEEIDNTEGNNLQFYDRNEYVGELTISEFHYHDSWDWLMEAVEKIEKLEYSVLIAKNSCCIAPFFKEEIPALKNVVDKDKISSVYNAVVQFINWYNLNKK